MSYRPETYRDRAARAAYGVTRTPVTPIAQRVPNTPAVDNTPATPVDPTPVLPTPAPVRVVAASEVIGQRAHVAYPHRPGTLYDCPGCEAGCECEYDPGHTAPCVNDGCVNGDSFDGSVVDW